LEDLSVDGSIILNLFLGNRMGVGDVDVTVLVKNRDKWLALFNTELNSG
jgi:hypothetical protein